MSDKKPTILILTAHYLPGFKGGGPIRTLSNLVDNLGHEFDFRILTSDRDFLDSSSYPDIPLDRWIQGENARTCYLSPSNRSFASLRRLLSEDTYDILYLNSFFSYRFAILPLLLRLLGLLPPCPVVLAPRGEFSPGALSIKSHKKNTFIFFAKRMGLYRDVLWQASSEHEAEDIRKIFGWGTRIHVAPNLPPFVTSDQSLETPPSSKIPGHLNLVFLSRISRKKNLDGALRILREVKGEINFDIYGPLEDSRYWEECQVLIEHFPPNVRVSYKGPLPHGQVKTILSGYDLFFLPTHGENFGHVILEALTSGCPLLISDQTPWRDLQSKGVGWDWPLNRPEKFQEVLQNFVEMVQEEHHRLSSAAREYGLRVTRDEEAVEFNRKLFRKAKSESVEKKPEYALA